MQGFADILRAAMGAHKAEAYAEHLRVSRRNLLYLLSGKTLPCGSTLALIEKKVAAGAGLTVGELRDIIDQERARRHGGGRSVDRVRAPARKHQAITEVCP